MALLRARSARRRAGGTARVRRAARHDSGARTARGTRVGVLGGGQLARMLAEAAPAVGVQCTVLAESRASSAAKAVRSPLIGTFRDVKAVRRLVARADAVVFENEFVRRDVLDKAARGKPGVFVPAVETIAQVQDKLGQKELLRRLKIPTADFIARDADRPLREFVDAARKRFPDGCVFKWAMQGYDGKGVLVADAGFDGARVEEFCREAEARHAAVLAERKIRFKRELAIIGCYSTGDEFAAYPLVVSEQWNAICWRVYGPAVALGVSQEQERRARAYARKLAESIGLYGAFALELFETDSGELLVNEIAPRVHNSGHYTQDAAETSQFENHWRAALGMPLGPTACAPAFAMLNLLGPDGVSATARKISFPAPPEGMALHWYGKEDVRPRRKLGHINATAQDPARLPDLLERMERYRKACVERLQAL